MKEQTQQKNTKAFIVTLVVHAAILAILLFIPLSQPAAPLPNQELGMEVNLGTSDDGMGDEQPLNPNPPAASAPAQTPQVAAATPTTEAGNTEELATQNEEEAPEVPTPPKPTPPKEHPKTIMPKPEKTKPKAVEAPKPTPAPPAPKPKAIFTSNGTSTAANSGNGANGSNNSNGEGNTGKPGDRGKINGDQNAKGYDGDGGTGNTRGASNLKLSGRSLLHAPQPTFSGRESGYVAVDIKVDRNGNVTAATYNPKGSTLNNQSLITIAVNAAKEIRYNANPDAAEIQFGKIRFYFKGQ